MRTQHTISTDCLKKKMRKFLNKIQIVRGQCMCSVLSYIGYRVTHEKGNRNGWKRGTASTVPSSSQHRGNFARKNLSFHIIGQFPKTIVWSNRISHERFIYLLFHSQISKTWRSSCWERMKIVDFIVVGLTLLLSTLLYYVPSAPDHLTNNPTPVPSTSTTLFWLKILKQ